MSGHGKKNTRPGAGPSVADWIVTHHDGSKALITGARLLRDQYGGYTFLDEHGPVADFPPGMVLNVIRRDEPEPQHLMLPPSLDHLSANGLRELQGALRCLPGMAGLTLVPFGSQLGDVTALTEALTPGAQHLVDLQESTIAREQEQIRKARRNVSASQDKP